MKTMRSKTAACYRIMTVMTVKWQHHFPHYKPMGIFADAQGHLTLQSVVGSGQISNSSELSCMFSLHASIKRTGQQQSRESGNTVSPIITLWELSRSVGMETRVLNRSTLKTLCSLSPTPMIILIKFGCDQPACLIDILV